MTMYKTDAAVFFPTACICGNINGPYADTGVELFGAGAYHVYLCERCGAEVCDLFGHTRREEREKLDVETEALRARVAELEAELTEEQADKFVSFEVARELLAVGPPHETTTATPKRPAKSAA